MPFYIQKQVYQCTLIEGTADDICTRVNICANDPSILSWEIDYSDSRSLHNWQQKLDLMCEPDWKAALLGTAFCLPWCFVLLVVPKLADKWGRKWIYIGSRITDCFLYAVVLFTKDYYVMICAIAGFGLCAGGLVNVGTVFLGEWFHTRSQTMI